MPRLLVTDSDQKSQPAADTRLRAAFVFVVLMTGYVLLRSLFQPFNSFVYIYTALGLLAAAVAWWRRRRGGQPIIFFALLIGLATVGHMHGVLRHGQLQSSGVILGILWPAAAMLMVGRRFGLMVLVFQFACYALLLETVEVVANNGHSLLTITLVADPFAVFTSTLLVTLVLSMMLWWDDVRESITLAQVTRRAEHDYLTGIANRAAFEQRLQQVMDSGVPFSVLALDLDHFKYCNDNLGHEAGDRALIQVARALRDTVRGEDDLIARSGGDEFAALLPRTDLSAAQAVAERMRAAVTALRLPTGDRVHRNVSVTIGILSLDGGGAGSAVQIRRMADKALYMGKREGRDCARALSADEQIAFRERSV